MTSSGLPLVRLPIVTHRLIFLLYRKGDLKQAQHEELSKVSRVATLAEEGIATHKSTPALASAEAAGARLPASLSTLPSSTLSGVVSLLLMASACCDTLGSFSTLVGRAELTSFFELLIASDSFDPERV